MLDVHIIERNIKVHTEFQIWSQMLLFSCEREFCSDYLSPLCQGYY